MFTRMINSTKTNNALHLAGALNTVHNILTVFFLIMLSYRYIFILSWVNNIAGDWSIYHSYHIKPAKVFLYCHMSTFITVFSLIPYLLHFFSDYLLSLSFILLLLCDSVAPSIPLVWRQLGLRTLQWDNFITKQPRESREFEREERGWERERWER